MVERICKLIKEKGMSISAVEKQLGFGNGAIKRFDKNSPSIDKIISLSNFLNVSIDYLIYGKENAIVSIPEPTNQLTLNEQELLKAFSKFTDREQIKIIAQLEMLSSSSTPNIEKIKLKEIAG